MSDYASWAPDLSVAYVRIESPPPMPFYFLSNEGVVDHTGACREAFRRARRDVWDWREARLRATWESYG